jgi:replicative superfamily II helicase
MFHILSYVCDGTITTPESLFEWYKKTLSSVQNKPLDMERCSLVLRNLEMRDMITNKNGEYKPTILGKITSRMYMSPLDVSDWYRNFSKLYRIKSKPGASEEEERNDNLRISMALGQCYNWGVTWKYSEEQKKHVQSISPDVYITEMEKNTPEVLEVASLLNRSPEGYPTIKYVSIFYQLLNGGEVSAPLTSYHMGITRDVERIISTLEQCDNQVGRYFHKRDPVKVPGYGWGSDWKNLGCRLKYGVRSGLAELVDLPWVGKKKAETLEAKGITTKEAFCNPANMDLCEKAVGKKTYQKILEGLK